MDALDLEILCLIQNDARVAHASVGAKLGLTAPAIHARIKRLEREGTIRGYLTSINPEAVKQTLLAFVRITNNSSGKEEIGFEEYIRTEPCVLECHIVSGEDTHLLKIRTDSAASLRDLLARLREFPGVARTVTSISLCTIKESGGPPLPRRESDASASVRTQELEHSRILRVTSDHASSLMNWHRPPDEHNSLISDLSLLLLQFASTQELEKNPKAGASSSLQHS